MSEKIEPALTAWEWEQTRLTVQAEDYDSDHNAAAEIIAGPGYIHLTEHEHPRYAVIDTPQMLHALAALSLRNQPFGFTREDVAVLRGVARTARSGDAGQMLGDGENIESLADRIEALLPPEVKRGICPERMSGEREHLFVFGKATCECGERPSPHMR